MTMKGYYALCVKTRASFGEPPWKFECHTVSDEDVALWPRFWQYKVYADIRGRFLQMGCQTSEVIKTFDFQGFRTPRLRHLRKWGQHYYILFSPLSPFHWPQNTWPWMTLNGWMAILLKFSLSKMASRVFFYLFTLESVYIGVISGGVESAVADRDPQNTWNSRKNCGSFIDATWSES